MSNFSDYIENKLVDHIFRAASFTKPTNLYIALFTSAPSDSGGGTEVSGGSYARQALNPSDTNWYATQGGTTGNSSGTGGATSNAVDVVFPQATANWGTVVALAIFDAVTGGNLLFQGSLSVSKTINTGDQAKLAAGDCDIVLS